MRVTEQNKNTWLFIIILLLAGLANVLSRVFEQVPASLMTALNYVLLTGLLLFWIRSVRVRLLPSAARNSIFGASLLMLLYLLLRIFKYRFAVEPVVLRYFAYAYWIPQMLIPAFFLISCIRIRRGEQKEGARRENLLLLPAVLLAAICMTNDLHFLVYKPNTELAGFIADTGTFTRGPVFLLLYAWIVLAIAAGIFLLLGITARRPGRPLRVLLPVIALWVGIVLLDLLYLDRYTLYRPYNVPEANTFGLLAIFEICIRYRLIPYNENYTGFFRMLQLPVLITDRRLAPAYSTQAALAADREALLASLSGPVELPGNRMLYGREIHAGYSFWAEDESGIRRVQEKLRQANETIRQENDLIRAETEQKEKDAFLQSRHRIYHEIAEELYPVQKRISGLLDHAQPGTDSFRENIAAVSVLNAYVKRKTNLLLLASENDTLQSGELALALQESAYYLTLAGLRTTAGIPGEENLPARQLVALYDAFEGLAEQLTGKANSLMVSWKDGGLRLAADTDKDPGTEEISLPVTLRRSEDILYIDILPGKEVPA